MTATITAEDLKQAIGDKPSDDQRMMLFRAVGYEPHDEQLVFHFAKDREGKYLRRKLVAGGEQAGKSYSAAMELFSLILWGSLFWIVGPDYGQTHNEFNYLQTALEKLGALRKAPSKPEKGAWKLETVWGAVVETKSAVDVATIAGKAPDGILMVEAAQCSHEAFLRCVGRTGPKRGWLCINGTFEKDSGQWYRQAWKAGQLADPPMGIRSFSLPSWTNHHLYPGGREDPELQALETSFGLDHFLERFGGVPVPPKGLVHREFDYTQHVRLIERVKGLPGEMFPDGQHVILPERTQDEVWVDPGYRHAYAILFVTVIGEFVIVYDEIWKKGLTHEEMIQIAMRHPRWKYVKKLVMDVSGRGHPNGSKSPFEAWKRMTGMVAHARRVEIQDGIERVRMCLLPHPETKLPQLILGTPCEKTAWEFSDGYRYPETPMGEPLPTEKPNDLHNDAVKAIVYGLVHNFGIVNRRRRGSNTQVPPRRIAGWELLYGGD